MVPGRVERPVPASQAFGREDYPALCSQAAALLLLRSQVRRDAAALAARAATSARRAKVQFVPPRDHAALGVPRLPGPRMRVPEDVLVSTLTRRCGAAACEQRAV